MRVMGALVQMDGRRDSGFRLLVRQAWQNPNAKSASWLVTGMCHHKLQALHIVAFATAG